MTKKDGSQEDEKIIIPGRRDISSIIDLPLKSQYRVLHWYGLADGTNLTLGFNINDIANRYVVLKSFKIVPYYKISSEDFYVNDGVVSNSELIPPLTRINRIFDEYETSTLINLLFNNASMGIFSSVAPLVQFPLDLDLDNIFYLFKAKCETWNIQITGSIVVDLENNVPGEPYVKVVCECYII